MCQLCNAREFVEDVFCKEDEQMEQIGGLLCRLPQLNFSYEKIRSFGKSLVPQDGHPANFLVEESGALHLVDLDDFSYDFWFADLARS